MTPIKTREHPLWVELRRELARYELAICPEKLIARHRIEFWERHDRDPDNPPPLMLREDDGGEIKQEDEK